MYTINSRTSYFNRCIWETGNIIFNTYGKEGLGLSPVFSASAVVLLCLCAGGRFYGKQQGRPFFNAFGADEDVCWITEQLRLKNDSSDFVPAFVGKYGYPLWKEVYRFPEGENVVYAVPVKSVVPDSEINSIWFFSMGQDSTTYRIYTREMAESITARAGGDGVEETWMFDYFTINALHKKPESGISFVYSTADTGTRAVYESWECVHAFAGYEGNEADLG